MGKADHDSHHCTTPSSPLQAQGGMPLLEGAVASGAPPATTTGSLNLCADYSSCANGHYNHHLQHVQQHATGEAPPYNAMYGGHLDATKHPGQNGTNYLNVDGPIRGMGMRGCVASASSGVSGPNVVPLPLLKRFSAAVECPACRAVGPTNIEHKAGKGTHGMAVLFFFTTGIFFFIPYVADHFKDVSHSCIRCGRALATHHFGTGTEAHLM